jgi:glycosyltransferase involved in cell wall biosynthesis
MKLSIAIPYHGDRWSYVEKNLRNLANDLRVAEVVIVDDYSDVALYDKLRDNAEAAQKTVPFPIRVFRNDSNLFVFRNKCRAVEAAKSEWVCLLDSDNVIDGSYLGAWELAMADEAKFWRVFLPEFARPDFDYRQYSGLTFSRTTVAWAIAAPMFRCLLNTMNFVVNRDFFLRATSEGTGEPYTADSMWINYLLLKAGGILRVTPGMQYDHAVHDGSTWRLHHQKGDDQETKIAAMLAAMR